MTTLSVTVFVLVYLGMALGRMPGLAVDRTGVALLGLIVLLASEDLSLEEAGAAVDMPTIALLFALMILSAQFEHSGFYGWIAHKIVHAARNPKRLLAVIIAVTGVLAAIFTNDVVVFALAPLVAAGLMSEKLDPRPYLIGLAGAANAGSAATLIGNPQNILIGQAGGLDFWKYLALRHPADHRMPGDHIPCGRRHVADAAAAAASRRTARRRRRSTASSLQKALPPSPC